MKMNKRKFDVKLRKVGNSYVVTIPKDTIDRFDLKEGDFVAVDLDIDDVKKPAVITQKEKFLDQPKNPKKNKDFFDVNKPSLIKKSKGDKNDI